MRRLPTRDGFRAFVAERRQVEARQQLLPGAEQDRRHSQVHLFNQASLQVLANGGNAASEANVPATCHGPRQGIPITVNSTVNTSPFFPDGKSPGAI